MAQQFYLDLKQIPDEQTSKMAAQVLVQTLVVDNVFKKQIGKDFFNKCLRNLQDERASPELKFNTLSIFRHIDLTNKSSLKVFSILTSHPLFAFLVQQARNVDPRKAVTQKGKSLFPKNKEMGNKYMRLLLESIKFWNQRFATTAQKQPTKYRKTFLKLVDEKITFPETFIFYNFGPRAEEKTQKATPGGVDPNKYARQNEKEIQKVDTKSPPVNESGNGQQQKVSKSSIMLLFNKIQSFIDYIDDTESIQELTKQINKNHKMFEKQQKRLQNSNVLSIQDDRIVNLYLKMNEFFLDEIDIYEEWIVKKDSLKMYIDTLLIKYDSIFAEEMGQEGKKEQRPSVKKELESSSTVKNQRNKDRNEPSKDNQQNETTSIRNDKQKSKQDKRKYQSVNSEKEKEKPSKKRRDQDDQDEESPKSNVKQRKSNNESDQIKDRALRGFFDSHLEKPGKKSLSGFKAIKQSLQKDKKQLKAHPGRSRSPINTGSKSKFNASTVSKIQPDSIFAKPPNPNIRSKKYDGTFVLSNPELESVLHDIEREQGMKRFKISNLKNRALLFQSEHIQIGYKSEAVYQNTEISNNSEMILLQLYIGNKTKEDIRNLSVQFQGDQKSLVYSSPQRAPETIYAGDQCIFTVIVIPCSQSYTMTMMHLAYTFNSYQIHTNCLLPSTILKFASYEKADVRQMNDYQRTQAIKCYQTQKFQLSHYFPPRKIAHYIEELNQITNYSDFVENGSEKDFVLGAFVTVKNKHQGLLKINVRPDLSVVLQLQSQNQSQEAQKDFKLYLQTLWMVLKEHK